MRPISFLFVFMAIFGASCSSVNVKRLKSPFGETVSIHFTDTGIIRVELLGWSGSDTLIVSDATGSLYALAEQQIRVIVGPTRAPNRGAFRVLAGVGTTYIALWAFRQPGDWTAPFIFSVGFLGIGAGINDILPVIKKPPLREKKGFDLLLRYPQPLSEEHWKALLQAKGQDAFYSLR